MNGVETKALLSVAAAKKRENGWNRTNIIHKSRGKHENQGVKKKNDQVTYISSRFTRLFVNFK